MGSISGVFTEREAKGLTPKQKAFLKTYYIGSLVSSKEVIKLAKQNPRLMSQIVDVAMKPNLLAKFVRGRPNIKKILRGSARPMLEKLRKK